MSLKNVKCTESTYEKIKELQEAWGCVNQQDVMDKLMEKIEQMESREYGEMEREWQLREKFQDMDFENLRTKRGVFAIDEKIQRAFDAITNHNDNIATESTHRYAITNQALRQVSGSNGRLVSDWMNRKKTSIDDHNSKYHFHQYSNKGKAPITQVINIDE